MKSRLALACTFPALLLASGCGDKNRATVTGSVLLDKQPLSHAAVQFWPKDDLGLGVYGGKTDENGKFQMKSRLEDFVKPGKYVVLIARDVKVKDGKVPDASDDMMELAKPGALRNTLPPRYFDRANPVFVVDIQVGHNELPPFELTSQ